jgi:hypothetical protein
MSPAQEFIELPLRPYAFTPLNYMKRTVILSGFLIFLTSMVCGVRRAVA